MNEADIAVTVMAAVLTAIAFINLWGLKRR